MTGKAKERDVQSLDEEALLAPELRASSVVAALAVSPNGAILAANDCLLRLLSRKRADLIGQTVQTTLLARAVDWRLWEHAAAGRSASAADVELKAADGRAMLVRGDIRAAGNARGRGRWLTGLFVDVTRAQQFENALHHAARMEAVASLTSGIAHDFSNLLTVLVGNLYLISEGVRDREPLFDKARLARDAAKRGVDLIRQLLAFARNERLKGDTLEPAKLIANLEPLLARALGAQIKLLTGIEPGVGLLDANAAQLESVIVNLVINARDAIKSTGNIRLEAANVTVGDNSGAWSGVQPGQYVRISVADDGAGIPAELLDRVFDPFFSTKGEGKGTGLGLSMVRRFAHLAGGAAVLESQPGKGTTVSVLLPRSIETSAAATIKTMPLSTLPGGSENILLFTEDQEIASTVEEILAVLGYRVIVCKDWREALETLRAATVHLVLIDTKSGSDLLAGKVLRAMRQVAPSIRAAVLSSSRAPHPGAAATLLKPFDLAGLATAVRMLIDGERRKP